MSTKNLNYKLSSKDSKLTFTSFSPQKKRRHIPPPEEEEDRLETISQMRSRIENGDLHEKEVNINDVSLKNVIGSSNIKSIKRMLSPSRLLRQEL